MQKLSDFLEEKTLYYDKIDYTIIQKAWETLQPYIKLPYVIHIVGTNGKGSTGRYLASLLTQAGKKVLHYSSPHIIEFNERIWINGNDSTNEELEYAHQELSKLLDDKYLKKLTYFEYTTLLALYLSSELEYLVLEAGLGGEFDATNVVKNNLSVFTPIGYDHQNFLGDTLKEITTTKIKSCDTRYIFSKQKYDEVYSIAQDVLKEKTKLELKQLISNDSVLNLPKYLQENFNTILNVLEFLGINLKNYKVPNLFGRFQKIATNITIDVGHNPLAASVLAKELERTKNKVILIYNSFEDKDFKTVLTLLKPYIKEIQIIDCKDQRIIKKQILIDTINDLGISTANFDIMKLEKENYYLVFGSFFVVEEFLKGYRKYEKR